jgi:hypothetical protein
MINFCRRIVVRVRGAYTRRGICTLTIFCVLHGLGAVTHTCVHTSPFRYDIACTPLQVLQSASPSPRPKCDRVRRAFTIPRVHTHGMCVCVGATIKCACLTCAMAVSFTDLPHDVHIKILCDRVLNDADVTHCGVTCRRLHALATHDTVWHRRYVRRYVCAGSVHK